MRKDLTLLTNIILWKYLYKAIIFKAAVIHTTEIAKLFKSLPSPKTEVKLTYIQGLDTRLYIQIGTERADPSHRQCYLYWA